MAEPGKTENATPRRREEARKKGQVARSSDLNAALVLLAAALLLRWTGGGLLQSLEIAFRTYLGGLQDGALNMEGLPSLASEVILAAASAAAPLVGGLIVVGMLANYLQVGFLFTPEPLTPRLSNISPATGFGRIFSRRAAVDLVKSFLKIGVIGSVAYATIKGSLPDMVPMMGLPIVEIVKLSGALAYTLLMRTAAVLLVMAALDYLYQRYEFEDSLKMTKQEVRDEYRQMEGDPLIKGRIQRIQRERSRRRMIADIREADVVVTNPVHLAVALRYKRGSDPAPVCLAKGARLIAEKIKAEARRLGVPVVEDPPLAQALFKAVDVGGVLPENLFAAVAQVLAHVYRAQNREPSPAPLRGGAGA